MKNRRLVVISVDALFAEDKELLETRPNFKSWLDHASGCVNTKSVYPTVTYPNHVAMDTGCYADRSGLYSNYHFVTSGDSGRHWIWEGDSIKVDTIFDAAKKAGYTTANGFWPVTCYSTGSIDYHIPEYWLVNDGETVEQAFLDRGTSPEVNEIVKANKKYLRAGVPYYIDKQPEYDDFIVHCDCDIIRKYKPEVLLTHWCVVDDYRHRFGIDHPKVKGEAMDWVDHFFGMIVEALKDAGVYEETDIFVVSDHGQMDTQRKIRLNAFLVDRGLITLDAEGKVRDYTALMISQGMSCHIHLKDPSNKADWQKTYGILNEMAEVGIYGFQKVFTKDEVRKEYHLDGPFDFVLEGDGYTSFLDGFTPPYVWREDRTEQWDHRHGKGNHGFMPSKGPKPMLWCKGPHIRPDVWLPEHEVVDEAPTYALLLGAELPDAQGKPMEELLDI